MGLTVKGQMAKNLTVNRQKRNIFTVNRQNSRADVSRQKSQISLIKNLTIVYVQR